MRKFKLGANKEEALNLFPEGKIKRVHLDELTIGIVRLGEGIFGFELDCPHRGASLVTAFISSKNELTCPLHFYSFDLESGKATGGFCPDLKVYSCQITEEGLIIHTP